MKISREMELTFLPLWFYPANFVYLWLVGQFLDYPFFFSLNIHDTVKNRNITIFYKLIGSCSIAQTI